MRPRTSDHRLRWAVAFGLVAVVVVLWNTGRLLVDGRSAAAAYSLITLLVAGDGVLPILPGETTLNAGCVLAANGALSLPAVMACGALGAVAGDSALYWLARRATGRVGDWLARAGGGKSGARVVPMLERHGNAFLLFGRYVPGLRFALAVTLGGIVRMPYRQFLLWTSLSAATWSVWTCVSAYFIGSALAGYPVAALVVSTFAGTALIGAVVWLQSRFADRREIEAQAPSSAG